MAPKEAFQPIALHNYNEAMQVVYRQQYHVFEDPDNIEESDVVEADKKMAQAILRETFLCAVYTDANNMDSEESDDDITPYQKYFGSRNHLNFFVKDPQ